MTELIEKQILSMVMVCLCGTGSGLIIDTFRLFKNKFFYKKRLVNIICTFAAAIVIAYFIGEYSYYCQNGKLTFTAAVAYFTGLLLWYKYFYGIISLGEEDEQKRKKTPRI